MRIAHSWPRRPAALIIEYLVWSLAVAAVPGVYTMKLILKADPQDIYDNQGDIVRGFANWSMPVFMAAVTPLLLMVLWRMVRRLGHDASNAKQCVVAQSAQATGQGLSAAGNIPTDSTVEQSRENAILPSAFRLYLEYAMMVLLTPLIFVLCGFVIGGARFAGNVFELFSTLILIISAIPGSLIALRLLLKPLHRGLFANQ